MSIHLRGLGILLVCAVVVTVLANAFVDHLQRIG
jgi:hypothetical protein